MNDATTRLLYKKNDPSDCSNYRVIALVLHAGKVLLKVVANRRSDRCMPGGIFPEQQHGVNPAWAAVDKLL